MTEVISLKAFCGLSVAVINTTAKGSLGRTGSLHFLFHTTGLHSRQSGQDSNRNLEAGTKAQAVKVCCLLFFLVV